MAEKPPNWRQMSRSDQTKWHKDLACRRFDATVARANSDMNAMPSNENSLPVREKAIPSHETNKGTCIYLKTVQSNSRSNGVTHGNEPDEHIPGAIANAYEGAKVAKQAHSKLNDLFFSDDEDQQRSPEIPLAKLGSRKMQDSAPISNDANKEDTSVALHNVNDSVASTNKVEAASSKDRSIWSDRRPSDRIPTKEPMSLKRKATEEKPEVSSNPSKRNISPPMAESTNKDALERTFPLALPAWYRNVDVHRDRLNRGSDVAHLYHVRDVMGKYKKASTTIQERAKYLDDLRMCLHEYEHKKVDEILVKKSKLLESHLGLPLLFMSDEFPPDIRGDAKALYLKWCRRDFDPDLLRGISESKNIGKGDKSRLVSKFDKNYASRLSAAFFGTGDLVNGQWWPNRLCALRDGAHGSSESGIYGPPGEKGAASIVLSGSHYDDEDKGDVILYCGTEGSEGKPSEHTRRMIDSIETHNPLRVLRTDKLDQNNLWRPIKGIRYDGLYNVIDFELLNAAKAHYRFRLQRVPGQDPIRNSGIGSRPTLQDVKAFDTHRGLIGAMR